MLLLALGASDNPTLCPLLNETMAGFSFDIRLQTIDCKHFVSYEATMTAQLPLPRSETTDPTGATTGTVQVVTPGGTLLSVPFPVP